MVWCACTEHKHSPPWKAWAMNGDYGWETHGLRWRALGVVLHVGAGAPQPGLGAHTRAELFTLSSIRSDQSPQLIIHLRVPHSASAADVISAPALDCLSLYWFINPYTHQQKRPGYGYQLLYRARVLLFSGALIIDNTISLTRRCVTIKWSQLFNVLWCIVGGKNSLLYENAERSFLLETV